MSTATINNQKGPDRALIRFLGHEPSGLAPCIEPDEWPQLQRNPQHMGSSPQEVRPPYRYYLCEE